MERYVIRGGEWGYRRLQVLARSWQPTTSDLFDRVGVALGMHCLDLGCGGGEVTFELARRVGPDGSVVGIDMDEVKLELARNAAVDRGVSNVEFRAMDVYAWTEPGRYDLVYCRFLLQHLSRPVDVLRAMWQAVAAGGAIAVEDADFDGSFCDPPNDGFAFWVDAYQRVLHRRGGDPHLGRKLHRLLPAAGIPSPAVTLAQRADSTGDVKTLPYSTIEATAEAIVQEGIATAEEVEAALTSLADFAEDRASLCGSPRVFQAWSRRPLG